MEYKEIFNKLWEIYKLQNPSVTKIYRLFSSEGENIENDHIAFRTFNHPKTNIDILAKTFTNVGYHVAGEYFFKEKKLKAVHFENNSIEGAPKVFISELILEQCSGFLRQTITDLIEKIPVYELQRSDLIMAGNLFGKPSHTTYQKLREESEYAAWLYVYGFRANHFTVSVNSLKKFNTIEKVNHFLKNNGLKINLSGGEIKGTPEMLLQQSSTLADIIEVEFLEGIFEIPACYYEFALRYKDKNGELYNGFHEKSADKIFESTNYYKNDA
ncbi:MAG: DUF1338 domain-containing protein [Bacteroidales bacterium]